MFPPPALARLTESTDGQLLYQVHRARGRDGSTALLLEPLALLERLAALARGWGEPARLFPRETNQSLDYAKVFARILKAVRLRTSACTTSGIRTPLAALG